MRKFLQLALALWIGRWLAGEIASFLGHRPRRPGPNPLESPSPPGWMPGPERGMEET